jgi:uncharacterized membrane protein
MSNASPTSAPAGAKSASLSAHRHPLAAVGASRWVAAASLIALIILGLAWELWLAPTGSGTLALKVLPLCIPLAGLLKNRMYTYRWVSLMVWLYFTEGVVRAWSDRSPGNWLAGLEVLLCVVLFVACTMHIRLRLKHGKATALAAATESQVTP